MHLGDKKTPNQPNSFFLGFQTHREQLLHYYVVVLEIQTFLSLSAQRVSLGGTWFAKSALHNFKEPTSTTHCSGTGWKQSLLILNNTTAMDRTFQSTSSSFITIWTSYLQNHLNQFSPESWKPKPWRPATAEARAVPRISFFLYWSLLSDEKQTQEQTKA